jgi:hypothetical protein
MFLDEVEKLVYESCGFRLNNVCESKDNEAMMMLALLN